MTVLFAAFFGHNIRQRILDRWVDHLILDYDTRNAAERLVFARRAHLSETDAHAVKGCALLHAALGNKLSKCMVMVLLSIPP